MRAPPVPKNLLRALALAVPIALALATTSCGRGAEGSTSSADAAPRDAVPAAAGEDGEDGEDGVDAALHERCTRSIEHLTKLIHGGVDDITIGPREAAIIDATKAMSIASCGREGLTPAQEECVLAAQSAQDLGAVGECPAIVERKPNWLRLPPTKAEQEALLQAYAKQIEDQPQDHPQDHPQDRPTANKGPAKASD